MNHIIIAMIAQILMGVVDVFVKGWFVMDILLPRYGTWSKLPNFWKDSIPNDKIYRIRWVYVLTLGGLFITFILTDWRTTIYAAILLCGMWEHLWNDWIGTLIFKWYRDEFMWTHPNPVWLKEAPWVSSISNGNPKVKHVLILATVTLTLLLGVEIWNNQQ